MSTKYFGTFDLSALLSDTKKWLEDNNFSFGEPKYKHKIGDTGAEIEIEWDANMKINYYVKENVFVFMKFTDIKDVDVLQEGEKVTLQQGRALIEVKGRLDLDYQKRFAGNKFLQELQDILHKYILKKTIAVKWVDRLYKKVYNFNRFIRQKIGMETPG